MSVTEVNSNDWLAEIPMREQRQDGTKDQLNDLIQVANRLGMYDAADAIRQIHGDVDKLTRGCFVEAYMHEGKLFEVDETCVLDTGDTHNCIYAKKGMRKEQCEYWRINPAND